MAEQQDVCSLLMVSRDLEWMHAFAKGLARFYRVQEETCETLEDIEARLSAQSFDVLVLSADAALPGADKIRALLQRLKSPVPFLMIDTQNIGMDEGVKQGADYVIGRRDLLSAIKTVQQIMSAARLQQAKTDAEQQYKALAERYDRLYLDVPDPVCYVRDGIFIDVNPAFMRTFAVDSREALDDLTLMNFVPRKSERNIKEMLRMALAKEVVPTETLDWQSLSGEKMELQMFVSQVHIAGEEDVVQVYLRNSSGGGSGGGLDPTTGLPGPTVLRASIRQTQERQQDQRLLGIWTYIFLENYREVWQKDGYNAAELLITAVVDTLKRGMPPSTEMARFTDDGIVLWAQDDKETVIGRIQNLIPRLDEVVPDNVGRLVHPRVYAGMIEVHTKTGFNELVSRSFRAASALAKGQSGERVAEPAAGDMSRKDERRVQQLHRILDERRIKVSYQPISSLDNDGIPRYAERITILPGDEDERMESEDINALLQAADRYGIARQIDRVKINTFLQDALTYDGDQKALRGFIHLTIDALNDETFAAWTLSQFKQTGISPAQIVFEMSIDVLGNAFSGAINFINALRPHGTQFALTEIGRFDDDIRELLERMKPDILKLDMREIDTFEDDEEQRFMKQVKDYADEHNVMLIADYMESPAQLSRVWPYDIKYLQGNGMVAPMDGFHFDFSEPLF
ncbi:MAG: EAL domain-containing protein [Cardiobacteriaceae bacterium]|nr:EAL domain-containing protein [Cardiobacteriaceae bacterium]